MICGILVEGKLCIIVINFMNITASSYHNDYMVIGMCVYEQ